MNPRSLQQRDIKELKNDYDEICKALSNGSKVIGFILLAEGKSLKSIANLLGIPRSSFQRYIEQYLHSYLIEKNQKGKYRLTPLGEKILKKYLEIAEEFRKWKIKVKLKRIEKDLIALKPYEVELEGYESIVDINKIKELLRSIKNDE